MKRVRISLEERSYQVLIGNGIVDRLGKLYKAESQRAVLISDVRLKKHRVRVLKALRSGGWNIVEIAVKAGESLKNLEQLVPIYGRLLEARVDRNSTLFALGGGTVGDAAGFIASTYLRGIPWVGLPTTLLGQVDSSVGGKTAVNHAQGKNIIGTFHQPALVICESDFLKTLSPREIISGLGEVVKYGLVYDAKLFGFIRKNWSAALALEPEVIGHLVKASLTWKAKVVAADELDRTGVREVLNFGHTFGHALETVTNYQEFQHGEAVLWGMRFALALSKTKRRLSDQAWSEADQFLRAIPLPPLPDCQPQEFFSLMSRDKKAKDGKVRFVLLKSIGAAVQDRDIKPKELFDSFRLLKEFSDGGQ